MGLVENERLARTIAFFDAANTEDPPTEEEEGKAVPRELLYARRLSHARAFALEGPRRCDRLAPHMIASICADAGEPKAKVTYCRKRRDSAHAVCDMSRRATFTDSRCA